MDNLNYLFYEEFTKLNRLCTTIYQMEDGVAGYIAEMGGISNTYGEMVPKWGEDFEVLCRCHMTYCTLTQSADAFRECLTGQEDVDWVKDLCSRIMERKDPLALLQERGYRAEDDARERLQEDRSGEMVIQTLNPRERYVNGPLVVWVIVIGVVLACLISILVLSQI